jgi:hypothetical protein
VMISPDLRSLARKSPSRTSIFVARDLKWPSFFKASNESSLGRGILLPFEQTRTKLFR